MDLNLDGGKLFANTRKALSSAKDAIMDSPRKLRESLTKEVTPRITNLETKLGRLTSVVALLGKQVSGEHLGAEHVRKLDDTYKRVSDEFHEFLEANRGNLDEINEYNTPELRTQHRTILDRLRRAEEDVNKSLERTVGDLKTGQVGKLNTSTGLGSRASPFKDISKIKDTKSKGPKDLGLEFHKWAKNHVESMLSDLKDEHLENYYLTGSFPVKHDKKGEVERVWKTYMDQGENNILYGGNTPPPPPSLPPPPPPPLEGDDLTKFRGKPFQKDILSALYYFMENKKYQSEMSKYFEENSGDFGNPTYRKDPKHKKALKQKLKDMTIQFVLGEKKIVDGRLVVIKPSGFKTSVLSKKTLLVKGVSTAVSSAPDMGDFLRRQKKHSAYDPRAFKKQVKEGKIEEKYTGKTHEVEGELGTIASPTRVKKGATPDQDQGEKHLGRVSLVNTGKSELEEVRENVRGTPEGYGGRGRARTGRRSRGRARTGRRSRGRARTGRRSRGRPRTGRRSRGRRRVSSRRRSR